MDQIDGEQDEVQPIADQTELAEPGPVVLPPEVGNLMPLLLDQSEIDDRVRKFISETLPDQVVNDFSEDWESRSGWMTKRKERLRLYLGDIDDNKGEFQNVVSMHQPILLERILRVAFRIYGELFKDREPLWKAMPSSQLSEARAQLITMADHWQFSKEMSDFPAQVMRAIIMYLRDGDAIVDSYYDPELGVNRHEALSPDEFVYPYTWKTSMVDMSDVPRKTKVLYKYRRDVEALEASGMFSQTDKILEEEGTFDNGIDHVIRDVVDKYEGNDRGDVKSDAPFTFLEYRGWARFPGHDSDLPVRVTLEYKTKTIVSLMLRQYDDPIDRIRFDKQSKEFADYAEAMSSYAQIAEKERMLLERIKQPDVNPQESLAIAQQVQAQTPPAPVSPEWMKISPEGAPMPPLPCKQRPIETASHAVCIENPDGSHGIGIGTILMPFQKTANKALNQFAQSATLGNSMTGFLHESVKLDPGITSINPNEILRVRGIPVESMGNAFFQIKPPQANQQLLELVKIQTDAADGVSNAPDVLSGDKDGPETFRGQSTRIEQAVQQISVIAGNFIRLIAQVAKNNGMLNFQFMQDEKIVSVIDPATQQLFSNLKVTRDLYQDSYDIQFSADMKFESEAAKRASADDVLGMLTKGIPPELATTIFKPQMYAAAARNCLKARGQFEMIQYVKTDEEIDAKLNAPPPGAPPGPPMPGQKPSGPVPPSVPSGTTNAAPGAQGPNSHLPHMLPVEAAPAQVR
jgi:hypothetical protein